jgi:hypothetical protein
MAEKDEKEPGYKPEFEIVEEGEESTDKTPADKAGKYADDERLSASQRTEEDPDDEPSQEPDTGTADEIEARRERRRRERKAQKARQNAARDRDAREMHFLRTRNEQLERAVGSLDQRMSKNEASQIDNRLEQLKNARNEAEEVLAQAIEANNGGDVVKLNRTIRELEAGINRLAGYRQQLAQQSEEAGEEEATEEGQEEAPPQRPPPSVIRNLQVFGTRHKWFDPTGSDEESRVVLALDAAVKDEGYDPATKDYWIELEDRMKRRLPERMGAFRAKPAGEAEEDDDEKEEAAPARRANGGGKPNGASGGPRMSSGSQTRGSGKQFLLSSERKQAMIEAGVWDDPELRDKYVQSYAKWDKEHPQGAGR